MQNAASHLANGAMQAVGQDLTNKVIQTPQAQQALQYTASGIAQTGAVVVGTAVTAGGAVVSAGTAVVAGTTALAVAAAPVVLAGAAVAAVGYGAFKLWECLEF